MSAQPALTEPTEPLVGYPAGTTLETGSIWSNNGMRINLSASRNDARTLEIGSHIAQGGRPNTSNGATPIWELYILLVNSPIFLLVSKNRLKLCMCYRHLLEVSSCLFVLRKLPITFLCNRPVHCLGLMWPGQFGSLAASLLAVSRWREQKRRSQLYLYIDESIIDGIRSPAFVLLLAIQNTGR